MSGHSKWSKIKHAKGLADAKKGKIFSKYGQQIAIAAKEGGAEIDSNPTLRLLVDKAKGEGMPSSNIERAINRGAGVNKEGVKFEDFSYEGMGPAGVAFIIDVSTDNKNRAVADLRLMFSNVGGNLSEGGSLSWNFETKGRIEVRPGKMQSSGKYGEPDYFVAEDKDEVIMNLMDISGILDINEDEDENGELILHVFTVPAELNNVKNSVLALGYVVNTYQLVKVAKLLKELTESDYEKVSNFIDTLEEYSDVEGVWTDANL